jgi:PhzF family phenazine biosynthesis protein
MQLSIYQIDAFTDQLFSGNPAAVIPLNSWLDDKIMQLIALENNLSETAFFVKKDDKYHIRWFTPAEEVALCGHATLASAYVIFNYLDKKAQSIEFYSKSGPLIVTKSEEHYQLNFPAIPVYAMTPTQIMLNACNKHINQAYTSEQDYLIILESEQDVKELEFDASALKMLDLRGVIVSAKGEACDFVSRCFYPNLDVSEDPVTGSAHCQLAPYWGSVLKKSILHAKQLSARGGELICEVHNDRVYLRGKAVLYLQGTIFLD